MLGLLQVAFILDQEIHQKLQVLEVKSIDFNALQFEKSSPMRGGFAVVHRAKLFDEHVAVKSQVNHPDDMIQEVKILCQISGNPNIVQFRGISM